MDSVSEQKTTEQNAVETDTLSRNDDAVATSSAASPAVAATADNADATHAQTRTFFPTRRIIGIVGCTQSGSTMIYNYVRLLCKLKGIRYDAGFIDVMHNKRYTEPYPEIIIVKSHDYSEYITQHSILNILCYRDIRDAVVSTLTREFRLRDASGRVEVFHNTNPIQSMLDNIRFYNNWVGHAQYKARYEDIKPNPRIFLEYIADQLDVELTEDDITALIQQSDELHTTTNKIKYDDLTNPVYRETLITKQHNTSGGRIGKFLTAFSPEQLRRIHSVPEIRAWLLAHNYPVA